MTTNSYQIGQPLFKKEKWQRLLVNKIVVITGGSRGIGRSIALLLAEKGANIIICARSVDELEITMKMITAKGGSCSYFWVDLIDPIQIDNLVSEIIAKFNCIDILINNAGIGIYKPFVNCSLDDWNQIINTNLRSVFLCCKAIAPYMMKKKDGHIINIASGAGKKGMKNFSIYCASKFGLIGLTESISEELKQFGVNVSYLCPGYVRTDFFRNFPQGFELPQESKDPEEIAEKVLNQIVYRITIKGFLRKIALFKKAFSNIIDNSK